MSAREQTDSLAGLLLASYVREQGEALEAACVDVAAFLVEHGVRMPPRCPECLVGKCRACSDLAIDPWTDEPRSCECEHA